MEKKIKVNGFLSGIPQNQQQQTVNRHINKL